MSEQPFWQQKTLDDMTDAEWNRCVTVAVSAACIS